jgi:hypothetical protein
MRRRIAKIGLSVRSPGNGRYLQARRVAWLTALLVAVSLAEGSWAGVVGRSSASRGQEQIFRLGRSQLAPTRAG